MAIAIEVDDGRARPGVLAAVLGAGAAAAFFASWRLTRRPGLPDLLESAVGRTFVEDEGVQFCAYVAEPFDPEVGRAVVALMAKSCLDARREVRVSIELARSGWLHLHAGGRPPPLERCARPGRSARSTSPARSPLARDHARARHWPRTARLARSSRGTSPRRPAQRSR